MIPNWPWRAMNRPISDWHGQRVWIIGASSGIGAALARAMLQAGAQLAISARRQAALATLAKLHQANRSISNSRVQRCLVLPFDITDAQALASAHKQVLQEFGGLDLVIFCAAKYRPERSWQIELEEMRQTLAVNLASVYQSLHSILPPMLAQKRGGIALVASVAGYMGLPNASVYGPSKAALINLAELLYADLHPHGINVHLINPGFVQTELTAKNDFMMPALQTPEQAAQAIMRGLARGEFEIHFPRRFTQFLKLMQMLPYRWRFALFARFLKLE